MLEPVLYNCSTEAMQNCVWGQCVPVLYNSAAHQSAHQSAHHIAVYWSREEVQEHSVPHHTSAPHHTAVLYWNTVYNAVANVQQM